jgi:hypothetical protein
MNGLDKLHEELQKAISNFDTESNRHRELYRKLQTRLIVLTAGTTIVAGAGLVLTDGSDRTLQFTVLGLAAATTAFITWLEMLRVRKLLQHERKTNDALVDLQREINSYTSVRVLSEPEVAEYFQRMTAVLGTSSMQWGNIQDRQHVAKEKGVE